jgi:hypothetical protein
MTKSIGQKLEEDTENILEPTTKVRPQNSNYIWLYEPESGNRYLARCDSDGRMYVTLTPAKKVDAVGVLSVPANSGGTTLSSGEIVSVTIKALVKNSGDIYVGGADNPPYSGYGYCLEPGESWSIDVENLNKILVVAEVSGDKVTWGALK